MKKTANQIACELVNAGLIKATVESSNYLNEFYQRTPKQTLRHFQNTGYKFVNQLDGTNSAALDDIQNRIELFAKSLIDELEKGIEKLEEEERKTK